MTNKFYNCYLILLCVLTTACGEEFQAIRQGSLVSGDGSIVGTSKASDGSTHGFAIDDDFVKTTSKVSVEEYWNCPNPIKTNRYGVGQVSVSCSLNMYMSQMTVEKHFRSYIYDFSKNTQTETPRYISKLNALIDQLGSDYLEYRKPEASDIERDWFVHMVKAIAYQESTWSHYRKHKDGIVRIMRGDKGHGWGLMQIDDRWHFNMVKVPTTVPEKKLYGRAVNIVDNIVYALDKLFKYWQISVKKPCPGASGWKQTAQSAYSLYNGGLNSKCRWQTNTKWVKNDERFMSHLENSTWEI